MKVGQGSSSVPAAMRASDGEFDLGRGVGTIARVAAGAGIAAIYLFLLSPVVIIALSSFSATSSGIFPPSSFSLRWYTEFLHSRGFIAAFRFSLGLGLIASVVSTAIGLCAAYAIVRLLGRRRELGQSLVLLPMMLPQILVSVALLFGLMVVPIPEIVALIVGHVLICLPFTVACIIASLDSVDVQLESAALTLGASRFRVLREVTIPLVALGLLSALILAFIVSFGDVYVALFLSSPGHTTLPIEIFSYMQWESTPVVAAITTVQVLLIVILGLVVERLIGLRQIMRA